MWIHDWREIRLEILALVQIHCGFVHQGSQLVPNGLELLYFYRLLALVLAPSITWSIEEAWILAIRIWFLSVIGHRVPHHHGFPDTGLWTLLLLHLHALVSKHPLPLLHEIHLHVHCLLEILISKVKNLLESLLIHTNHVLLILEELGVHVTRLLLVGRLRQSQWLRWWRKAKALTSTEHT